MLDDMFRTCPICGKTFAVPDPTQWVYKAPGGSLVCSYHCMNDSRRNRKSDGRYLAVEQVDVDGSVIAKFASVVDCAKQYNLNPDTLYGVVRSGRYSTVLHSYLRKSNT